MKKTFLTKTIALALSSIMLSSLICIQPQKAYGAIDDFTLFNETQIGTQDENGQWIFYADLKSAGATPYNIERAVSPTTPLYEHYFYNNASPNFSILMDTDLSTDDTGIRGQILTYGSVMPNTPVSNSQNHAYYKTDWDTLSLEAKYDLVTGVTGYKDLLRYEYVVTNHSSNPVDIAGIMNGDTALGAFASDWEGNSIWFDRALVFVDGAEKYIYNEQTNPNGFLGSGGQIQAMTRFVDHPEVNTGINGIPLTWQNITSFDINNIQTAFYSVKPDQASTGDHLYPVPNLVDFKQYNSNSAPTSGIPYNPYFIANENQISGQLMFDSSPDGLAPAGQNGQMYSDSQTSIQWNKQRLAPEQSVSFVYFVGRGKADISNVGNLNFFLGTSSGNTFPIQNNIIEPMDVMVNLKNIGNTPIDAVQVKLYYDPIRIQPLDQDKNPIAPIGYETAMINGETKLYPYMLTTLTNTMQPSAFSMATFTLLGMNNTLEDINTYIQANVSYTDELNISNGGNTPDFKLVIPGKLKEDKSIGFVHVLHKDKTTGDIIFEEYVPGISGDPTNVYSRYFAKYTLSDTADDGATPQSDSAYYTLKPLIKTPDTHTFWYEERPNDHYVGGIIVRHLDADYDNPGTPGYRVTLAIDHVHGRKGSTYTATAKTWPGYHTALNPEDQTVTFEDGLQVIDYFYPLDTTNPEDARDTYRNLGTVFVNHRDITNQELITRDTFMVDFDMAETSREVTVKHIDIESFLLDDEDQKTVRAESGGVVYTDFYYVKTGFVHVQYLDKDSGNLLYEEYVMGSANTMPDISAKLFTSYNIVAYPDLSTVRFAEYNSEIPDTNGIPTIVFQYSRNLVNSTGDILIAHIEKGNPLHVLGSEHIHGAFGATYVATPKNFIGYLPNVPGTPVEKTFDRDPQKIVFEYEYDLSNSINIDDVLRHDAIVTVEHKSKEDDHVLAKDTLVVAIPDGTTEQTTSFAAGNFMGYVIDGEVHQEKTLTTGVRETVTFYYTKNTADLVTAQVTFLDKENTPIPSDATYAGIPDTLVDLRQIPPPEGYVLDEINQGEILVPLSPNAPLYIKVKPISEALTTDVYIQYQDIRGIQIPGISYTEVDPNHITPAKTNMENEALSLTKVSDDIPSEAPDTNLSDDMTPPTDHVTTDSGIEAEQSPEIPFVPSDIIEDFSMESATPFFYNEKKVGMISGIPFNLEVPQISNYTLRNPDEFHLLFFDSEARKGYVLRTISFIPETVSYHLTVRDKNNLIIKEIDQTVPWGTVLRKEDLTTLLRANGLDTRYVLDSMTDITLDEGNTQFNQATGIYQLNVQASIAVNKNNGSSQGSSGTNPPAKTYTQPKEQLKVTPEKETPANNKSNTNGITNPGTRAEGIYYFQKPFQILMNDELIPLSNVLYDGSYVVGYPDGTLRPEAPLTRAQAMQMIYNIYGTPLEMIHLDIDLKFSDVGKNNWYANAIAFGQKYGIIHGYTDGTFRPNLPITRAEFISMILSFQGTEENAYKNHFIDTENHWAKDVINNAYLQQIVTGYDDGTFRPHQQIKRAESVVILNKLLQRPNQWLDIHHFPDLQPNFWAYDKMMNATNGFME